MVVPDVEADPSQDEMLKDGQVSEAEMERALFLTVECVGDLGYYARLVSFDGKNGWDLEVAGANSAEADLADEAMQICSARFLNLVAEAYHESRRPSEAEIAARNAATIECLVEAGYPVSGLEVGEVMSRELAPPAAIITCDSQNG